MNLQLLKTGTSFFIFLCVLSANAQNIDLGSWNILNFKLNINQKTSFFAEAQVRSLKLYDDFHYHEYKGGVNYKVLENVIFTIGLGNYQTYKEGGDFVSPKNNNEFRIWPQIAVNQKIEKVKIEQRFRTEMRYTSNGYRNRFRYRIGISHDFWKTKDNYNKYSVGLSNEFFFTDNEPFFERNRLLLNFDYKLNKVNTLKFGYLHQFDYKINDETGRDFLQIGYFIDIDISK